MVCFCCVQDEDSEAVLAADFEIGHFIRERIVPRAVLYFTGEAIEDDDDDVSERDASFAMKWNALFPNIWPMCFCCGCQYDEEGEEADDEVSLHWFDLFLSS